VGSSESKAKGSFGQKQFYFSNMGETALEEEPRGTLNIMIFLLKEEFPAILWQKLQHSVFVCGSCHL
jgi:hypothetical protein